MATEYSSFGRTFVIKGLGIEKNMLEMGTITGLNWTGFVNTKLAHHFNLKPVHENFGGIKELTEDEQARLQTLRAQYLLLSSKSSFNPSNVKTDDLVNVIKTCQAELTKRSPFAFDDELLKIEEAV